MDLSHLNVTVVGLGLMGGSLALALRGSVAKIIGVDLDSETRRLAKQQGVVDAVTAHLDAGVAAADLVILAVPVRSIVSIVQTFPEIRPNGCLLLDLGSTKNEIGRAMEQLPEQFSAIGGHPMCGLERSGLEAASANLYRDKSFILCRNRRSSLAIEQTAVSLVFAIGSQALFLSAEAHDRLVATSSHLPYLVSSLLMRRAWSMAQEDERLWQVSASGLQDTTRLAGSSPQMMLEILLANREAILKEIEAYGEDLAILADQLQREDKAALSHTLESARRMRTDYLESRFKNARPGGE